MRGQKSSVIFKFFITSIAIGLCVTVLYLPVVAMGVFGVKATTVLAHNLSEELKILPPSQQSVILAADGSQIATFYSENRIVVPLNKISKNIQNAVVAIEDKRFYKHKGVDLESVGRALIRNIFTNTVEGASTLTQQYVKNSLLETALQKGDEIAAKKAIEPTIVRKLKEAKYAIAIEKKLSKKQILQGYLNIAPFGAKVYGVEAASRYYFGHSAKDLSVDESTLLAGITQSPITYDPVKNPENAKRRQNMVAKVMLDQRKISKDDYERIVNTPIEKLLKITENPQGCATAGNASYFCSYVVNEISKLKSLGKTQADRRALLLRGGLTIKTTLDPKKQDEAFKSLTSVMPVNGSSNVKGAVTSVEPGTGHIVAMAQNTNWGVPTQKDPTATQVSFNVDQEHGGGYGKQTGSTFKIFTLAEWFKNGHDAQEVVGGKYFYSGSQWNIPCSPENAVDYSFEDFVGKSVKPQTVLKGTQQSLNSVYMAMAQKMNLCEITKLATNVGVEHGDKKPISTNPSAVLGSNDVPPLNMTNAFASFGARGKYCKPKAVLEIVKQDGTTIYKDRNDCKQVIDSSVADKVNMVLNSTWRTYSAPLSRQAAAKTGTTDDGTNLWFIGYTPNLATTVWIGHSEGDIPVRNVTIGGVYYPFVYGETIGSKIWSSYMNRALAGMPVIDFVQANIGIAKVGEHDDEERKDDRDDDSRPEEEHGRKVDLNDPRYSHLPPPPPGYEYVFE